MTEVARDIETLRLHPDAERVPLPDGADLAALRVSLQENGQEDPIDITDDGTILDGRTRWTLLRQLGARSIRVREVDCPKDKQTAYIVDRALARRHLTMAQKQALNFLLRQTVVETVEHPTTGSVVRIGLSRPERAAKLGVSTETIRNWEEGDVGKNTDIPNGPTHIRRGGGNPTPYPIHPSTPAVPRVSARRPKSDRPAPLRKSRPIPGWSRYASTWLRAARPEDRDYLRRLDRELHAALDRNGIECQKGSSAA